MRDVGMTQNAKGGWTAPASGRAPWAKTVQEGELEEVAP